MVRAKGHKIQEILTPQEKAGLMDERRDLESTLKEANGYGIGTQATQLDKGKLQRQIDNIDRAIASREPPKLSGADKDRLAKEAEELAVQLQIALPTRDEMAHPGKNPGAVRKHMNWTKRNQTNVERWRYIQRVLNPYDPKSIEQLRREK